MVTGMLKSIMKRKDGSNSGENRSTGKKSLQFVGILNGGWVTWNRIYQSTSKIRAAKWLEIIIWPRRYESTSSDEEEEEEEEEEDASSSAESGEGECLESTEEDEAALEEETSEEERNINMDESDTDEETLQAKNYSSDVVKEKYAAT